jgi:hypothetical protein
MGDCRRVLVRVDDRRVVVGGYLGFAVRGIVIGLGLTVVMLLAFRGLLSIIFDGPGWVW